MNSDEAQPWGWESPLPWKWREQQSDVGEGPASSEEGSSLPSPLPLRPDVALPLQLLQSSHPVPPEALTAYR